MLTQFEQQMKQAGLRVTSVRRAIFECLHDSTTPLSIQELVDSVSVGHFVSVYRSVDAMQRANIIKQVPQGFKNRYELGDVFLPHHHHISCERCGSSRKIDDHRVEVLMSELTKRAGFEPTRHHFEAYGICDACQSKST